MQSSTLQDLIESMKQKQNGVMAQPANQPSQVDELAALKLGGQSVAPSVAAEVPVAAPAAPQGPTLGSAGISAGAQLLGGLLANKAQQEQAAKAMGLEAAKTQAQAQQQALQQSAQGQQNALAKLIGSYRAASS